MVKKGSDPDNFLAFTQFLGFSFVGVFVFFIRVKIGDQVSIPIDHMVAFMKQTLNGWYPYLLMGLSGFAVWSRLGHRDRQDASELLFFIQAAIGFILSAIAVFGIGPEAFRQILRSAVNATGNIICAIFITALFIPFLTEYGLVDFCSVLCRPFMRKVFLTPGSSAVIGVSAFLGNYSVGHVVSKRMYDEGYFTEKEAVIVATGFSTCSIGLMINLVNYTGLMSYWHIYVMIVLIVTFLTTAIVSRLYPIRSKSTSYKENVTPKSDGETSGSVWLNALHAGVNKAARSPSPVSAAGSFLKQTLPLICEITGASMCVITIGMFCVNNTNMFQYLGCVFVPILRAVGVDAYAASGAAEALSVSILEPVLAGVISGDRAGAGLAGWIVSVVPYSAIVFFAGFVPSLWKSGINCRISEMLLIWLERIILGIFITAALFYLFSAAGLIL